MPPPHTAVGMIAAAVARLESNPFPARIDGATAAMLDFLGPEMPWPRRVVLANRWLTGGLVARQFAAKPSLNALIRTTMAATVARGGETANVLPKQAETVVNVRLLPGDTSEAALRRIQNEVKRLVSTRRQSRARWRRTSPNRRGSRRPTPTGSGHSSGRLPRTTQASSSPPDSRWSRRTRGTTPRLPRTSTAFTLRVTADDLKRIHGVDERIGIKTYADLIGFLARLIENLSAPAAEGAPERPSVR